MVEYKEIIEVLGNHDTVFLIGSGVSIASGLPSWSALLLDLATYCDARGHDTKNARNSITNDKFLEAADYLSEKIGQSGLNSFFEEQDNFRTAEPNEYHNTILKFPSKKFLTTNYDLLLETAYLKETQTNISVVLNHDHEELNELRHGRKFEYVYKYHGDIKHLDSIILNGDHYHNLKHIDRVVNKTLSTLIGTKKIVMIGFGLEDPDFKHIRDELIADVGKIGIEIYAFMGGFDEERCDLYKSRWNINIISYTVRGRDHSDLLRLLDEIHYDLKNKTPRQIINKTIEAPSHSEAVGAFEVAIKRNNKEFITIEEKIVGTVSRDKYIQKNELHDFVADDQYTSKDVKFRAKTLIKGGLIKETENYYLKVESNASTDAEFLIEGWILEKHKGDAHG